MSSKADATLSQAAQDKISKITEDAKAGKTSWADANKAANAVRSGEGAGYTVSSGGTTRYTDGSTIGSDRSGGTVSGGTAAADQYVLSQQGKAVQQAAVPAAEQVEVPQTTGQAQDLSSYLKSLYAAQTEAKLAQLKSTYEANLADAQAEGDKIPAVYQAQKNEAAAQGDVAQKNFNEVAAANGLNTGTTGQAALSNGIAVQKGLNSLQTAQANALTENDQKIADLTTAYTGAISQAQADGNTALAEALYNELVRQQQAGVTAASAAQEQANWEKEYELSLSQQQAQQAATAKEYAYKTAMAMIQAGRTPSAALLTSAGISPADAKSMVYSVLAGSGTYGSGSSGSSGSGSGNSGKGKYNNGDLTSAQVRELQTYYGTSADGAWGFNSRNAAGGKSANAAWTAYQKSKGSAGIADSTFSLLKAKMENQLKGGNTAQATYEADQRWSRMSTTQRSEIQSLLKKYGKAYSPLNDD